MTAPADPAEHRMHPVAVVVMTIAVLAAAVAAAAYVTHGFKLRTKVAYQVPPVFELRPGDCFNGQNDIGVTPRSCSSPHQAEVFATFRAIGPSIWPGDMALQAQAESGCSSRLAGYMSPDLALDQEFVYPDAVAWRAGVRTVVCDVRSQDGPITGSVRQAASS
ncbi:MAG TPA: septum formation family protein [Streptosporangiaceae bacterium]|nr:septum formation family protein [Streptosporangiaceae bacterium]